MFTSLTGSWIFFVELLSSFITRHGDFLFGWVFGLIGAAISPLAKSFCDKRRFEKAVKAELSEIRYRTLSIILSLTPEVGMLNRKKVEWLYSQAKTCPTGMERDVYTSYLGSLMDIPEEQLAKFLESNRKPKAGKSVPLVEAPFLEGNTNQISLLNVEKQVALIKVLSRIRSINGKIDEMIYWDRASHTTKPENYDATLYNSKTSMIAIIGGCEQLWKSMDQFSS